MVTAHSTLEVEIVDKIRGDFDELIAAVQARKDALIASVVQRSRDGHDSILHKSTLLTEAVSLIQQSSAAMHCFSTLGDFGALDKLKDMQELLQKAVKAVQKFNSAATAPSLTCRADDIKAVQSDKFGLVTGANVVERLEAYIRKLSDRDPVYESDVLALVQADKGVHQHVLQIANLLESDKRNSAELWVRAIENKSLKLVTALHLAGVKLESENLILKGESVTVPQAAERLNTDHPEVAVFLLELQNKAAK